LILLVTGQPINGVIILLAHFLVVTNIDNFLRPMVVPEEAYLSPSLTLISAFAGVSYFGFLGVIYGPIVMIFITTTVDMYIEQRKKLKI
jgi:predicted PurR-regulated permease PerM